MKRIANCAIFQMLAPREARILYHMFDEFRADIDTKALVEHFELK